MPPIPKLQLKVIFPTEVNDPRVSTIKLLQKSTSSGFSRKPKYGLLPVTSPNKLVVYILKSNSLLAGSWAKENFQLLITENPQIALVLLKLFCKRIYDQKRRFRVVTNIMEMKRLVDNHSTSRY